MKNYGAIFFIIYLSYSSQLFSVTLTWPDGDDGHILTPGAWGGSTYSDGDLLRINNGTVQLTAGNYLSSNTTTFQLGYSASSSGNFNIFGGNIHFDFYNIGQSGFGNLILTDGNIIADNDFRVAQSSGGSGLATINGGQLISLDAIIVGNNAATTSANMVVNNGFLSMQDLFVGQNGGANMIINGGNFMIADDLRLSNNASSTTDFIMNDGNIQVLDVFISDGDDHVNFWFNGGFITVGEDFDISKTANSSSHIFINGGNIVVADEIRLSDNDNSTSNLIMTNGIISFDYFSLGDEGFATMELSGGHLYGTNEFNIAKNNTESQGNLIMSGGNIDVNNFLLGRRELGYMELTGGNITARNNITLGDSATAYGELLFNGGYINGIDLRIGQNGQGKLTFLSGTLTLTDDILIANNDDSYGELNLYGGQLTIDDIHIGDESAGNLNVYDGTYTADVINIGNNDLSNGTLNMIGGNINVTDELRIADEVDSTGNLIQSGGNIEISIAYLGDNSSGYAIFSGGNFTAGTFRLGNNSGSIGNAIIKSRGLINTIDFNIGQSIGSTGYLKFLNGEVNATDFNVANNGNVHVEMYGGNLNLSDDLRLGDGTNGQGTFHFYGGNLNIDDIQIGEGGSGYMTVHSGNINVDIINVGQSSGSANATLTVNAGNINSNTFRVSNNSNSSGNFILTGGNMVATTAYIGDSNYGTAQLSGGNFTANDIRLGGDSLAGGNLIIETTGLINTSNLYVGYGSGTSGNITMNGGEINSTNYFTIGHDGDGHLVMNGGTINAYNFELSNNASTQGNLDFNSGNILISGNLWIDQADSRLRIKGGANLEIGVLDIINNDMTWEHIITSTTGKYDKMGLAYMTNSSTMAEGDLKIGIEGGLMLSSSPSYYLQVGTSQAAADNYDSKPDMWDISLVDNVDGTKDAIVATLATGNKMANFDTGGTKEIGLSNSSTGWISIDNLDPTVQASGLYVYLGVENADIQELIDGFNDLGYTAETASIGGHDIRVFIPASFYSAGTTYLTYDFRNVSTGQATARLNELQISTAPLRNGSLFKIK